MSHPKAITAHAESPPPGAGYCHIGLRAAWSERVVTLVAVSVAVLIVATIAVLMGMA
jgi:hypothetical protein